MQTPIRITYRHIDPSAALEARIREYVTHLEQCCELDECHVTLEVPAGQRRTGTSFQVNIELALPGRKIAVHSGRADRFAHTDIYAALRETFATVRRLLADYLPYSPGDDRSETQDSPRP
ncbi:MAG TPA: HPF/RaiA family ribosome-associated protein [Steroidobacteraceae bacterium]|nr:HPF/RaiA family ribosome-associated protein [Steroidobacteraceae bacterium]